MRVRTPSTYRVGERRVFDYGWPVSRLVLFLRRKTYSVPGFSAAYRVIGGEESEFVLRATGWKNRRAKVGSEVLVQVGMQNKTYKMPHELSGGEQQQCNCRALLNRLPSCWPRANGKSRPRRESNRFPCRRFYRVPPLSCLPITTPCALPETSSVREYVLPMSKNGYLAPLKIVTTQIVAETKYIFVTVVVSSPRESSRHRLVSCYRQGYRVTIQKFIPISTSTPVLNPYEHGEAT